MSLTDMMVSFEKGLRKHIYDNFEKTKFTHPQYSIDRVSDGEYNITISLTGLGTQTLHVKLVGDSFTVSGQNKILGTAGAFPFNIMAELASNLVERWMTQSVETMAASAAKEAGLEASQRTGAPVLAKVQLVPLSENLAPTKAIVTAEEPKSGS